MVDLWLIYMDLYSWIYMDLCWFTIDFISEFWRSSDDLTIFDPLKSIEFRTFDARNVKISPTQRPRRTHNTGSHERIEKILKPTLWLCQNSYWKWWFIVDFPIENGDFP
jgi:hypothetical protein